MCWQDLKSTLAQELDFENEGRNGERCARELHSLSYIRVPVVFWQNTSKVASDFLHLGTCLIGIGTSECHGELGLSYFHQSGGLVLPLTVTC